MDTEIARRCDIVGIDFFNTMPPRGDITCIVELRYGCFIEPSAAWSDWIFEAVFLC